MKGGGRAELWHLSPHGGAHPGLSAAVSMLSICWGLGQDNLQTGDIDRGTGNQNPNDTAQRMVLILPGVQR